MSAHKSLGSFGTQVGIIASDNKPTMDISIGKIALKLCCMPGKRNKSNSFNCNLTIAIDQEIRAQKIRQQQRTYDKNETADEGSDFASILTDFTDDSDSTLPESEYTDYSRYSTMQMIPKSTTSKTNTKTTQVDDISINLAKSLTRNVSSLKRKKSIYYTITRQFSKLSAVNSELSIIRDFSFSKREPVLRGVSLKNVKVNRQKSDLYSPKLIKCQSSSKVESSSNDDSGMQDEEDEVVSNVCESLTGDTELKGFVEKIEKISEKIYMRRTKSNNVDYSISFNRRRKVFENGVERTASGSYF